MLTTDPDTLSLIFWPKPFKSNECEIGLVIYDEAQDYNYYLYLNSELNVDDRYAPSEMLLFLDIVSKRREEVSEIYALAEKEWDL